MDRIIRINLNAETINRGGRGERGGTECCDSDLIGLITQWVSRIERTMKRLLSQKPAAIGAVQTFYSKD
jgi:hypothetical protein